MILHFSHIGFTDGRTFMIPFGVCPDEVALVTGTATATMPPERTPWRIAPTTGRARQSRIPNDSDVSRARSEPPSRSPCSPSAAPSSRRGGLALVPRGEDPWPLRRDGDGELEVGGERAVLGVDRPAVVAHPDHVAAGGDHRLDGQDHALLERDAPVGRAVVRDLGLLVHVAADAVADQRADDREALGLDVLLDGVRDVAEAVARAALLDGGEQRALGHVEELGSDRRDLADGEGAGGVGHPAVLHDADVDGDDVSAVELELARDAM